MGIGMLSMPFAMRQGGWLGLLALGIATAVFCLSGKLIVRNFEKLPQNDSHTYPALGEPMPYMFSALIPAACCLNIHVYLPACCE